MSMRNPLAPINSNTAPRSSLPPNSIRKPSVGSVKPSPAVKPSGVSVGRPSIANNRQSIANSQGASRKSSVGASINRQSGINDKRRPSSIMGPKGQSKERLITDMPAAYSRVLNYLISHGYPLQISQKIISSPMLNDYRSMIEFLFQRIDHCFRFENSNAVGMAEEIASMLRFFQYPFPFSKGDISAGTIIPNVWPKLLHTILWLVELLEYQEVVETDGPSSFETEEDTNDETMLKRRFYTAISEAYPEYMSGTEDPQSFSRFKEHFETQREEYGMMLANTEKEIEKMKATIADLNSKPSSLEAVNQKRMGYLSDKAKLENQINMIVNEGIIPGEQRIQINMKALEMIELEIARINEESDKFRDIIGKQELSVADVEKINTEKAAVLEAIEKEREEITSYAQKSDIEEVALSKRITANSKLMTIFEEAATKAEVVIPEVIDANNKLVFNINNIQQLSQTIKEKVKPTIRNMNDSHVKETAQIMADHIKLKNDVDVLQEQIQDAQEKNRVLEKQIAELKKYIDINSIESQKVIKQNEDAAEEIKAQTEYEAHEIKRKKADAEQLLKDTTNEKIALEQQLKKDQELAFNALQNLLTVLLNDKESNQVRIAALKQQAEGILKATKAITN